MKVANTTRSERTGPVARVREIEPRENSTILLTALVLLALCFGERSFAQAKIEAQQQRTRRSQRVRMPEVRVRSPDGQLKFTILPDAERLTYVVSLGNTAVTDPSPIDMKLDGHDLSSGVVFAGLERFEVNETYPWYGAHSRAVSQSNGVKISLVHDLSFTSCRFGMKPSSCHPQGSESLSSLPVAPAAPGF